MIVDTAGGIVIVGRDCWMINVPVVLYFGLIRGVSMWSQELMLVRAVSHLWTRCCNSGAGLQLVLVAWLHRIERVG